MSEATTQKAKNLAYGVTTVQIAGKDVFVQSDAQGVQYLHVASFLASVLNTCDNKAAFYWREKLKKDEALKTRLVGLYEEMNFLKVGKGGAGIHFQGGIILLQNVREKRASLDHCRRVANDLIRVCTGNKQELTDMWDEFDAQFCGLIHLEEIVPNAKIEQKRVNGVQYLNVIQLIMFACKVPDRFEARRMWKTMKAKIIQNDYGDSQKDILESLHDCHFRSDPTIVQVGIRFEGAIRLMFYLPGTFARAKQNILQFLDDILFN